MPFYTFHCEDCGCFEKLLSMKNLTNTTMCPQCEMGSIRVYTPPSLIFTPYAVRRRVEESSQPKRVKKEDMPSYHKHHHHAHQPQRPWQVGH